MNARFCIQRLINAVNLMRQGEIEQAAHMIGQVHLALMAERDTCKAIVPYKANCNPAAHRCTGNADHTGYCESHKQ